MSKRRKEDKNPLISNGENQDEQHHNHEPHESSDLKGDWLNISVLFFLYLLQGVPLGLAQAIPMLLQNRGISYKQQVRYKHVLFCYCLNQ